MSSRHLKKVFGESQLDELVSKAKGSDSEQEESIVESSKNNSKSFAKSFNLLNLAEGESDEEEKNETATKTKDDSSDSEELASNDLKLTKKKRKNRKKKKSKASTSAYPALNASSSSSMIQPHADYSLRSTSDIESELDSQDYLTRAEESLLEIDVKHISPEFELKSIFGAKIIKQEFSKLRRNRQISLIPYSSQNWPTVPNVIELTVKAVDISTLTLKFEHSQLYKNIQNQFMMAINSHDPQNIMEILRTYPYHIDSLIQISQISKEGEDTKTAVEMVEHAIFVMETSLRRFLIRHSLNNFGLKFKLTYKYQENRAFHILLFKHLTFVGQRACSRTALELCKLLLYLDFTDPLAITLIVDFYAIKSRELHWLISIHDLWTRSKNLLQLPNWAYSIALAHFLLSQNEPKTTGEASVRKCKTCKTHAEISDEMLQYAILMFPYVLLPLLDKAGIQCESRVKSNSYFSIGAVNSTPRSLKLLCDMYVSKNYYNWKEESVMSWMERNVKVALDKISARDPEISAHESHRKNRYQGTPPRNILRHIVLLDEKTLFTHIPSSILKEDIVEYDPFPPLDGVNIYEKLEPVRVEGSSDDGGLLNMRLLDFIRNFELNRNGENENNAEQAAAGEDAGGYHNIIARFVDYVRNVYIPQNPQNPQEPNPEQDNNEFD